MMQKVFKIVESYRARGLQISNQEAEKIYQFCMRKMDLAEIANREEYLPLLYEDEIKRYLLAVAINVNSMLQMAKKE